MATGTQLVRITTTDKIPQGSAAKFHVGSLHLAVYHTEQGWFATHGICSHAEEPLADGWLEGDKIECPRHGAQFDLRTGEALTLPAVDPIEVFRLELKGDEIWVEIPSDYLDTPGKEKAS